jgi:hypothetical protein
MLRLALAFVALMVAGLAVAKDKEIIDRKVLDPQSFPALADGIKKELVEGGRFASVQGKERTSLLAELDTIGALLAKADSVDALGRDDRLKLFNAQESANAILTHRDRDRLICERQIPSGSHRAQTVCSTYGERLARSKADRDSMRGVRGPGCGGHDSLAGCSGSGN